MDLPSPPKFSKLLGPSFILLGLGLGSGELILWPYLVSNWGMSIIWAAVLGVTLQFFVNMEIERYALARGESVFVGFAKKLRILPYWFILSTFFAWIWPGIIATSARLFAGVFGISNVNLLGIILLVLIGIILTLGPVLYKTVERFALILISVGVPVILLLTLFIAKSTDYKDLLSGLTGFMQGLPTGLPIATFLAAFAFAGAGGNLNLAQSFYIKEKGYGMGKFGGKITSILTGKKQDLKIEGQVFEKNSDNLSKFKKWWILVNWEHFLVFWLGGVVSILMLSLLAYATTANLTTPGAGIEFMIYESIQVAKYTAPFLGIFFLLIAAVMLFNTQLTVLDATSRIMAENLLISQENKWSGSHLPLIYYTFLWAQIIAGVIVFLFKFSQPLTLLIISAVLNAFSMFVHIGLTMWLNKTSLYKEIRPSMLRIAVMFFAFCFFGYFSIQTILNYL